MQGTSSLAVVVPFDNDVDDNGDLKTLLKTRCGQTGCSTHLRPGFVCSSCCVVVRIIHERQRQHSLGGLGFVYLGICSGLGHPEAIWFSRQNGIVSVQLEATQRTLKTWMWTNTHMAYNQSQKEDRVRVRCTFSSRWSLLGPDLSSEDSVRWGERMGGGWRREENLFLEAAVWLEKNSRLHHHPRNIIEGASLVVVVRWFEDCNAFEKRIQEKRGNQTKVWDTCTSSWSM